MPGAGTLYRAQWLSSSDLANATSESQFKGGGNGSSLPLILQLPSNGSLDRKRFRVHLSGRVQTSSSLNFTLKLYFGISATIASNTVIAQSGATAVNGNSNFDLDVDLTWDSDSQTINGNVDGGQIAGSAIGTGAIASTITGANPARDSSSFLASGAFYGFTVTGLFSGSSSGNHAIVDDFSLEVF